MPRVKLSIIDLEWVHVVCEGWASPLRGFMRQHEYLQALHFNSLRIDATGSLVNMSVPIVLAIDDDQKDAIASSASIALESPSDAQTVAILRK
jgi:3'-phosphoadenosine 5'-phosphosulfate synthase